MNAIYLSYTRLMLLIVLGSLSVFSGLSAQTSTIRGFVFDKQSETPIIGATIQVITSTPNLGTSTDAKGAFELRNVPVGRQSLRVTYLGYNEQTVPTVLVTAGKEVQLNLRLEESLSSIGEVVVQARTNKDQTVNDLATVSARPFNTEEVMRYSGGRSDVARLVTSFAGVAANNDARNDIVIRGNSPTGVLWRMEGVPIPNPNHFSTLGTTGGPVSALNPNLISTSDFLTGAFPAEYGNALAGVFDINLRNGNPDRHEFMFQLGAFTGLEAMAEGPFNKKNNGSFVASFRQSFVELASAINLNFGTSAVPAYRDLTFNVDLGSSKAGRFSIFGIGAQSAIDFLSSEVDSTDLFANPNENAYNTSKFGVIGLKHNILLGNRSYIRTVVSASHTATTYKSEDVDEESLLNGKPLPTNDVDDALTTYRFSSFYNLKANARMTLRTGILYQYQVLDTRIDSRDGTDDLDEDGIADWIRQRDFQGGFNQLEAFAQGQYRLSEALTLNAGVHALYFDKSEDLAVEPRAAINWQFIPRHTLTLGYGLHNQTQPLPVFFFRERMPDGSTRETNTNLGFTSNQHLVLGYDFRPGPNWRLKAEVYQQWIQNAPVESVSSSFSLLNAGADFVFPEKGSLLNEGTGYNRGVEFTAEKFFSNGYYGLLTVSLFESRYKGSDGIERSTAFDGGSVFNLLAGREFSLGTSGRRFLTLDTKFTYAGGRPYTPVNLEASRAAGREILFEDQAFSKREDDYMRWDFKIGFRTNSAKRKFSQTFFLDFQNVTNRDNVFATRYNEVRGEVGRVNQIGFFPDILYRVEF